MSSGQITRYVGRLTVAPETGVLEPEPFHTGWTTFVSQRSVRAIAVAPLSGHIWLATWGGVLSWNRKEERLYRRYSSEHGLAGSAVAALCLDRAERPWVAHVEGGLSYFDGRDWQVYAPDDKLWGETVCAMCSAAAGTGIWVAAADTLYSIPGPQQPPTPVATKGHDGVVGALALLADGDGLLIGNSWGLFRLGRSPDPVPVAPEQITACTALARDGRGRVWAGTPEGVYRLEEGGLAGPFGPTPSDPFGRVLALAAGRERVWVLTTAGLAQVIDGRWVPVPGPPQSETGELPEMRAIALGGGDTYLWVGTDQRLAGVYCPAVEEIFWDMELLPPHPEDGLNNLGHCIALLERGGVLIGTAGGAVSIGADDELSLAAHSGDIRSLCAPAAGARAEPETLWMLAWPRGAGLLRAGQLPVDNWPQPPGMPMALASAQDGYPYVITGRGLWRLGHERPVLVATAVPAPVRCLAQTPDERWWLGTTEGVYVLVPTGWDLAREQPGPFKAAVHALAVVGGVLWAATDAGLWERRGDGWRPHGGAAPARARPVLALTPAEDAGALWLARDDGVVCYDPAAGIVRGPYTPATSGLSSRRVTALATTTHTLWIVTQAGISRLKLDKGDPQG